MNRGNAHVARGEVKEGLPDQDRAIELDPRLALAYANRGWARLLLGDELSSEKDFERSFELDETLRIRFEPRINKQRRQLLKNNVDSLIVPVKNLTNWEHGIRDSWIPASAGMTVVPRRANAGSQSRPRSESSHYFGRL